MAVRLFRPGQFSDSLLTERNAIIKSIGLRLSGSQCFGSRGSPQIGRDSLRADSAVSAEERKGEERSLLGREEGQTTSRENNMTSS